MGMPAGMETIEDQAQDINHLLIRLTEFHLLNSAEGAFELRDSVRRAGLAYGARADLLAIAEGAVLTVGALALRGLATLNGDHTIQGLNDLRDSISLTVALTLGLIVGAAPMQAANFRPRRSP